jgi:fructose-bisphosphate aldolase, class II
VHREFFRDSPEQFDFRPPRQDIRGRIRKVHRKSEKLGSAGQLLPVRKALAKKYH